MPQRVFWIRRLAVIGTALLLVLGIGSALNAATNGSSAPKPTAKKVDAEISASPSASDEAAKSVLTKAQRKALRQAAKSAQPDPAVATSESPPAEPTGPCAPEDITVSPYVYRAVAWRHSYILLELKTKESPACTWHTSPETIALRVITDKDEIWTSRQCPISVPTRDLVLRNDVGVKIAVVWSGRRSDSRCTGTTRWAPPGWYRVEAAALAGEPGSLLFQLQRPEPKVVKQSDQPSDGASTTPESQPTDQPTGDLSGAVEPDNT